MPVNLPDPPVTLELQMAQLEIVSLDSLLPSTQPYRRFHAYIPDATQALADVSQLKGGRWLWKASE